MNNNYNTQGNGSGFAGYQPGMPITNMNVPNNGRGSTLDQMNQANDIVMRTLHRDNDVQPIGGYSNQQSQSQMQQAPQVNTQQNYSNPIIERAANVLLEQEARRVANESMPEFFRTSSNQQTVSQQTSAVSSLGANNGQQVNNSMFGLQSQQNDSQQSNVLPTGGQQSNGVSGNDSWWKDALGVNSNNPNTNVAQSTSNSMNATQANTNSQNNQTYQAPISDGLKQYGESVANYNARMFQQAMSKGVDVDKFKQTMLSLSPEDVAQIVMDRMANGQQSQNVMPGQQPYGNGYNNPQGQQALMPNGMPNNQQFNGQPNNQSLPPDLSNIQKGSNVVATGKNNPYPFGYSYGSEI